MLKILFTLFAFCLNYSLFAYEKQFVITNILTDENISIQRLDPSIQVGFGDVLAIYSHDSNSVLGYAKVLTVTTDSDLMVARVETHDKSGLIRPENYLRKVDLSSAGTIIPGRFDLVVQSESKTAAKFRPLVYTGLSNGMTAANLSKKEFLAGPTIFAYGMNNNWQINTNLISSMFKILNLGIKTKVYDSNDFTFSFENSFQYYRAKERGSYLFTGYLDSNSNSNFKNYTKFKIFTRKPEDQYLYNSEEYKNEVNVELSYSYGYMFNNWNQIIFGPKVDVNKKKVGGQFGYYVLDKNVNMMIGLSSNDFSEFKFGKDGYLLNFDLWWRF